jgi:hypothetical protein
MKHTFRNMKAGAETQPLNSGSIYLTESAG